MMVSDATFCEFVVFTKKDIFVQNLNGDLMFQNEMLEMLANFYLKHGAEICQGNANLAFEAHVIIWHHICK